MKLRNKTVTHQYKITNEKKVKENLEEKKLKVIEAVPNS